MHVSAVRNATISAVISFDFLANNYELELRDAATDELLRVGRPSVMDEGRSEEAFNFANSLTADLDSSKRYYLDIVEDLSEKDLGAGGDLAEFCHRFAFELDADVAGANVPVDQRPPHVYWVYPSNRNEINPLSDLTLNVYLSARLAYDANSNGEINDNDDPLTPSRRRRTDGHPSTPL